MGVALSPVAAGIGLGLALGAAPGAVQAVLVTEALRGGVTRGLKAVAGANVTFGLLLLSVALGITLVYPRGVGLRALELLGGGFLIWLAVSAFRSSRDADHGSGRTTLPPAARGALAVVLNPGGWLFLATAATSLFSAALHIGGRPSAVAAALALTGGLAAGDITIVLITASGLRAAGASVKTWVRRGLASGLGALGLWLIARAALPL